MSVQNVWPVLCNILSPLSNFKKFLKVGTSYIILPSKQVQTLVKTQFTLIFSSGQHFILWQKHSWLLLKELQLVSSKAQTQRFCSYHKIISNHSLTVRKHLQTLNNMTILWLNALTLTPSPFTANHDRLIQCSQTANS